MESLKICLIRREPCLLNYSIIFQKGTDGINEVSRLRNDNFTVRPGMHVPVSCRKRYIRMLEYLPLVQKFLWRKQGLHPERLNSVMTVFYVVVLLQREKRKLRNHVMSLERPERLIKQSIKLSFTGKMISGSFKLKDIMVVWIT